MLRAIVNGGQIRPLEPLPPDWQEGQALRVEKADQANGEASLEEIDRDFADLAALCESSKTEDEEMLEKALRELKTRNHPQPE